MSQYIRKCGLIVSGGNDIIDLSELHIKFEVRQDDKESPNNAKMRVYNLSKETQNRVIESSRVDLTAGYNDIAGIIFSGDIIQFKIGKENSTDTYLEILAADGDIVYNNAVINTSIPSGQNTTQASIAAIANSMGLSATVVGGHFGGTLPRGKVLWGMAKNSARSIADANKYTWSINGQELRFIGVGDYLPNAAVSLNSSTGLIGVPEQTEEGIKLRCLINPLIVSGGLIKLDNTTINQTIQQKNFTRIIGQQPYDKRTGNQLLASIAADGLYRVYVIEHVGDNRGIEWYSEITALTVNESTGKVVAL